MVFIFEVTNQGKRVNKKKIKFYVFQKYLKFYYFLKAKISIVIFKYSLNKTAKKSFYKSFNLKIILIDSNANKV